MALFENIKSLCTLKGISIPKLEKELGFGRGSIYNWEKSSPSIDKVEKVAKYFGVSINRVLYGFDPYEFTNLANLARGDRTILQFANDTGIEYGELSRICLGLVYEKPSLETVRKIAANNIHGWLYDDDKFLEAAGYISESQGDMIRKRYLEEMSNLYEEAGFEIRLEYEDNYEKVYVDHPDHGTVEGMFLHEFFERAESLLEDLNQKYNKSEEIQTIAAHHDGEDWTEEELEEIERFKEFVRMKRQQKKQE
jgi:hypothetical protein